MGEGEGKEGQVIDAEGLPLRHEHLLSAALRVTIGKIGYGDVEVSISELKCSAKRINSILVLMRALMKFAFKDGLIEKKPMALVGI